MDGNLPGMMTGVVPAPAPAPKVRSHRESLQRAHRVDGMMAMTMAMIGKDGVGGMMMTTMIGKAGEVVDMARTVAVDARVSIVDK